MTESESGVLPLHYTSIFCCAGIILLHAIIYHTLVGIAREIFIFLKKCGLGLTARNYYLRNGNKYLYLIDNILTMCCECFKISLTKKSISLTNKEDNNGTYISAKADKGASC